MKDDNFSDLPDWNEGLKDPDEEGEEWKPNPTKEACKLLYQQWSSVITMLNGCLKTDKSDKESDESFTADFQSMILGDA